jgi:Xaa-Pro dipeptidase
MRQRSDRIFEALDQELDAIVLMNGEAHLVDSTFKYVSGVTRGGYEGCAAVLRPGKQPTLVVSNLEEESAHTAHDCEILAYETSAARHEILSVVLGEPKRIGVNERAIVLSKVRVLERLFPGAEIVEVGDAIIEARLVKDEHEIERVRRACQVTSDVAAEIPSMLREGMTEIELAAEIAHAIQRRGGKVAFDTIVCFGPNGSEPHYSPGDTTLIAGHMVLVDFGTMLSDYCSDITRMYMYGDATPEQRTMFDVVRKAQRHALSLTRSGTAARDLHRETVAVIDASEFAGRFIHGTGHTIGLDVHDGGGINEASELTLAPGMILTVEPGVYVPGVGGVRIEDTVLVTEGDPEILTPVTKDLVEVPV